MEVITEYLGNKRFAASARGHSLICDQPRENRGEDTGMTPPELMLASLGTCAGYYAAEYLNTRGLASKDLSIRVSAEKAAPPARLDSFRIEVHTPGLDEHHKNGVLRAVKTCLIHNTLLKTPTIDVNVDAEMRLAA
jgi:uncharacterized OsmC-like protein